MIQAGGMYFTNFYNATPLWIEVFDMPTWCRDGPRPRPSLRTREVQSYKECNPGYVGFAPITFFGGFPDGLQVDCGICRRLCILYRAFLKTAQDLFKFLNLRKDC